MADLPTGRYPEFLVIGAQKAGTTWLYENLRLHERLWLPPSKEVHYFDGLWPNSFLLDLLARACQSNTNNPDVDFAELRWLANFSLTHPRTDAWYASLFKPAGDRVAGDITPAYSMLDDAQVAHVARLMPSAKIIFIMREPVRRIWSQFCFSASWRYKGIADEDVSDEYILSEMDTEPYELRTRYSRTIATWERHFPLDQILYLFFDDLVSDPGRVLARLCSFLGVAPLSAANIAETDDKKYETEVRIPRRPSVDRYFAEKYLGDLEMLAQRFGRPATEWLDRARTLVRTSRPSSRYWDLGRIPGQSPY